MSNQHSFPSLLPTITLSPAKKPHIITEICKKRLFFYEATSYRRIDVYILVKWIDHTPLSRGIISHRLL